MTTLIIYCHPSKESYTYQILNQLERILKNENIKFEISDLYEMNFQSEITEQEYMREGLLNFNLPIPRDVKQDDCPAKLKGWFDRVYSVGYAYGKNEKMKTVKYGISLCTAGHSNKYLDEIGIADSMRNIMIDDRLGQRFNKKEMIILGGTLDRAKVEKEHSKIVENIAKRIKKHCS